VEDEEGRHVLDLFHTDVVIRQFNYEMQRLEIFA
jgi:hypothetical protein